jgi:hypothetical protein
MWCFRAAVGRRVCVHCCCCSSVAQRRSPAQNKHPCLPTILTPPSPTYRLTIYHIFFRSHPANPNILSSPSHTALCGHDFFGFDPTVWSVPSVVEGTSQAIPRPGDAIAVRCTYTCGHASRQAKRARLSASSCSVAGLLEMCNKRRMRPLWNRGDSR